MGEKKWQWAYSNLVWISMNQPCTIEKKKNTTVSRKKHDGIWFTDGMLLNWVNHRSAHRLFLHNSWKMDRLEKPCKAPNIFKCLETRSSKHPSLFFFVLKIQRNTHCSTCSRSFRSKLMVTHGLWGPTFPRLSSPTSHTGQIPAAHPAKTTCFRCLVASFT